LNVQVLILRVLNRPTEMKIRPIVSTQGDFYLEYDGLQRHRRSAPSHK
jgi:hypothetical protein